LTEGGLLLPLFYFLTFIWLRQAAPQTQEISHKNHERFIHSILNLSIPNKIKKFLVNEVSRNFNPSKKEASMEGKSIEVPSN